MRISLDPKFQNKCWQPTKFRALNVVIHACDLALNESDIRTCEIICYVPSIVALEEYYLISMYPEKKNQKHTTTKKN